MLFSKSTQHQQRLNDIQIQEVFFASQVPDGYLEKDPTVWQWMKNTASDRQSARHYLRDTFPVARWIFNYNIGWLIGDLIAGITVGAVVIPQGMAYAKLAGLPVEYGLYTSFFGGFVYWIFGTSKDINIGPISVASLIVGNIIMETQRELPTASLPEIATTIALLAGAIIAATGLLRLGFLIDLVALPAVSAFTTGTALTVISSQIAGLLGITGSAQGSGISTLVATAKRLPDTKLDAAVGISSLATLYLIKWLCARLQSNKRRIGGIAFFLSSLRTVLVLTIFTVISFLMNRKDKENTSIRILGSVPRGLNAIQVPHPTSKLIGALLPRLPDAVIVLVIEHIAVAKSFGRLNGYTVNPNCELLAIGVTNLLSPFFGAYTSTGAFSRTAINSKAGSRSPMAGVIAGGVVLFALYTLTPAFVFIPNAVLSAVIIHAVVDLITSFSTLCGYWRISPPDVGIYITGLLITVFVSVDTGIFAMIAMSLFILLLQSMRSTGMFLGHATIITSDAGGKNTHLPGEPSKNALSLNVRQDVFLPLDRKNGVNPGLDLASPYPGVFVLCLTNGFNFSNANQIAAHIAKSLVQSTRRGTIQSYECKRYDRPWNVNRQQPGMTPQIDDPRPCLRAVVFDFSSVNNVDLTAMHALADVQRELNRHSAPAEVKLFFASVRNAWTRRALTAAGFAHSITPTEGPMFDPMYSLQLKFECKRNCREAGSQSNLEGNVEEETGLGAEDLEVPNVGLADSVSKKSTSVSVYGANRPNFYPTVTGALAGAICSIERTHRTATTSVASSNQSNS